MEAAGVRRSGEELFGLAQALLDRREMSAALLNVDVAEAQGAPVERCAALRWQAHMLLGDFAAAWRESDRIRAHDAPDPHRFWQGEALHGKRVMLRCLHGLGDAVQFLRYLPKLCAVASQVIVEVPPAMVDLAHCFHGSFEVVTWGDDAPAVVPEWDVQVEVVELPYLFRTERHGLPIATGYLEVPSLTRPLTSERRHANSLKVGVVWAAGDWNPSRSIPFAELKPLFLVEGCEFWNLQGGAARSCDSADFAGRLHEQESSAESLIALAALVAQMDLVVTPDTLAAHLTGALGVPAWVMLQHAADWRWMHEREDSPWYPTLRLFRQPVPGDWTSVVQRIAAELCTFNPKGVHER